MFYQIPVIHLGQQNKKIMAVQNGPFIQGRIGNLLYRIVKGRQIISQLPVKGIKKMSEKSISDCDTFGMATSLSSMMRKYVHHLIGKNTDMDTVNRLNARMANYPFGRVKSFRYRCFGRRWRSSVRGTRV